MITTLDQPCWRLVHAGSSTDYDDGHHEGTPHFDTEAEATASTGVYNAKEQGVAVEATQYPDPCHTIRCNGCNATPDDDEWAVVHWPTLGDAQSIAGHLDYVVVGERDTWCDRCKFEPHAHVGIDEMWCERCSCPNEEHEPAVAEAAQ